MLAHYGSLAAVTAGLLQDGRGSLRIRIWQRTHEVHFPEASAPMAFYNMHYLALYSSTPVDLCMRSRWVAASAVNCPFIATNSRHIP